MKTLMKILSFTICFLVISMQGKSQTYSYDYSNSTCWTTLPVLNPKITIDPVAHNVKLDQVPGAYINHRIYNNCNPTLSNYAWSAQFTMRITSTGALGGALIPFIMTAGTQPPLYNDNDYSFAFPTNQDAAGISIATQPNSSPTIYVMPYIKDGINVFDFSTIGLTPIQINQNTNYAIKLERMSMLSFRLTVTASGGFF
jgi:hypothetical protein